jgi:cysteine-S-conjugate beta-lyase
MIFLPITVQFTNTDSNITMHPSTQILHPAKATSLDFNAQNIAVYRASTVLFPNAEAVVASQIVPKQGYSYGTHGTPTTSALETAMAVNDGGTGCALVCSGLAALSLTNLALLKSGDHVLIADNGYEPNRRMFAGLLNGLGVTHASFNPLDLNSLNAAFTPNTKLVWAEPVGSNTLEVCDLSAIAAVVHARGALLAVDHTWTAGVLLNVFKHGADLAIQAMTKYQSGHGDVLMGSVVWADDAIGQKIKHAREMLGYSVSPDDCSLVLRGMQTMHLRLKAQGESTVQLAHWLATHSAVAQVLHPAMPTARGHDIWRRDYSGSATLFSFTLKPQYDQAAAFRFVNALQLFGIGFSWGSTKSLALNQVIHRQVMSTPEGQLIRLQIGLEHVDDLRNDLAAGFAAL